MTQTLNLDYHYDTLLFSWWCWKPLCIALTKSNIQNTKNCEQRLLSTSTKMCACILRCRIHVSRDETRTCRLHFPMPSNMETVGSMIFLKRYKCIKTISIHTVYDLLWQKDHWRGENSCKRQHSRQSSYFFLYFSTSHILISESSPSLHAFLPSFPSFSFLHLSLPPSLSFFCSSFAPSWSDLVLHLAITHYVIQNYLELLISHLLLAGLSVRSLHSQLNVSNFIAY